MSLSGGADAKLPIRNLQSHRGTADISAQPSRCPLSRSQLSDSTWSAFVPDLPANEHLQLHYSSQAVSGIRIPHGWLT